MKWFAGFEGAYLHWNGRCMVQYTQNLSPAHVRANHEWAMHRGFSGTRDTLPHRLDARERARAAVPGFPTIWSLHHFGPPPADPEGHASYCVDAIRGEKPLILPVVEPSVGWGVSGMDPLESFDLSVRMMRAVQGRARFMTGDPIHGFDPHELEITDRLVETGMVEVVGVHFYAHHARAHLADVIGAVKQRYRLPVVLGETGLHEGHHGNHGRPHGCQTRAEWITYVNREAQEAEWACWMPVLPVNWDGGEPWPSGWPEGLSSGWREC